MFALLGQMHERYLVWGAVVSAVALGVSVRLSIIHFIISAASTAMIVHVMLVDKSSIRRCARLTCCTTFGRTHRFWCLFVWLFTSGMRSVGGFRRFDVEPLKRSSAYLRWIAQGPEPEEALQICASPFGFG